MNKNMKANQFLVAILLCCSARASAITITLGNPGNQGTDNVLFNDPSLQHSGTLVQGNFAGMGNGFIVDFTSSSGNHMMMGSGGQSTITGLAGNDPFTSLTFALEGGATFTKAILNPDATVDGHINFTVSYIQSGIPYTTTFTIDGNGQNFFGIEAGANEQITSVTFDTSDSAFDNASQFRIGGFGIGPAVADGGTTIILLGAALVGLELFRRVSTRKSWRSNRQSS